MIINSMGVYVNVGYVSCNSWSMITLLMKIHGSHNDAFDIDNNISKEFNTQI